MVESCECSNRSSSSCVPLVDRTAILMLRRAGSLLRSVFRRGSLRNPVFYSLAAQRSPKRREQLVEPPIDVKRRRESHEARDLRRAECVREPQTQKEAVAGFEPIESRFERREFLYR